MGKLFAHEWAWALTVPLLVSLCVIAWLYQDNRDERIVAWFYDERSRSWPWQGHWLTKVVLHDWVTGLVTSLASACLIVAILASLWRSKVAWRRPALYLLLCIAGSAGVVGLVKSVSPDPSPWEASQFGGEIHHGTFFRSTSPDGALGQSSPGAFATGGFALMSLYYLCRKRSRRMAWALLATGWLVGGLFGVVQVVRGAHYPSHNYWSAVFVWSLCTLLYWGPFRGRVEYAESKTGS